MAPCRPVLPAAPRSLAGPEAIAARRHLVACPHMTPLQPLLRALRAEGRGEVPDFDPLDGGADAEMLFLLEKPSRATLAGAGSGFTSRDNDNPTGEAIFRFMCEAGIDRRRTLLANTVPWWNGTAKVRGGELAAGLQRLPLLLALLPQLRVVVGVGATAARALPVCEARGLRVFGSLHPSPNNRAARPQEWREIGMHWRQAAEWLDARR